MNEQPNLIRDVSQWIIYELYDEVSDVDRIQMEPQLAVWLTGFRYTNRNLPRNHQLLAYARREADHYYRGHIQPPYHTWQDKVLFMEKLTRALLMACDCYSEFLSDDPRDWLRPEAMHCGYYVTLTEAITRMMFDMGTKDRAWNEQHKIVRILQPFLPLN
ncbi:hypothetical protein [Spirosoma aerophilum]